MSHFQIIIIIKKRDLFTTFEKNIKNNSVL